MPESLSFSEYLRHAASYLNANPSQRPGQAYFNCLVGYHPELAEEIRSGDLDPFYQNERIPDFLTRVCEVLDE